jgi:hypothetical protein
MLQSIMTQDMVHHGFSALYFFHKQQNLIFLCKIENQFNADVFFRLQ